MKLWLSTLSTVLLLYHIPMTLTPKNIIWTLLFAAMSVFMLGYTTDKNTKPFFKPVPTTITTKTEYQALDAQQQPKTYVITKQTPGYKDSPYEKPAVIGLFVLWIITYIGAVTASGKHQYWAIYEIIIGIPMLIIGWVAIGMMKH